MLDKLVAALIALFTSVLSLISPTSLVPRSVSLPTPSGENPAAVVVASNLEIPWAIAFLPNRNALFTERPGRLNLLTPAGQVKLITQITDVKPVGEGGLLGLAIDPHFATNQFVYLYFTYQTSGENTFNRVVRYVFDGSQLSQSQIIIDSIPGNLNHNGGRLKFGPDGKLYITTGDAQNPSLAQNQSSLAGKILTWDGQRAEVYSLGHRNPQGLAWDEAGQLWEVEHGPTAHDEINKIIRGANYGWPTIVGTQTRLGMTGPVLQSGDATWAPSGMSYSNGALYFAGLRGQTLYKFDLASSHLEEKFSGAYGRLRDVVIGPDNYIYLLTSNRDGRGVVRLNDDLIVKVRL
ncbi:MAG: PQQ-dependent sugar dehydrogenase [bacterium]|nr:PQQ-dependent sugar dehydrogenase [bacterium]